MLLGSGERGSLRAAFAGEEMDHLRHPIQQRFVPGIGEDREGSYPAIIRLFSRLVRFGSNPVIERCSGQRRLRADERTLRPVALFGH